MAEQKPRAPRARKKAAETEPVAAKPAVKKKATTSRRQNVMSATEPADVAVRAYLLWEQGEPGDATEHWLRAEQELLAA